MADGADEGAANGDKSEWVADRKERRRQELLTARRRGQAGGCAPSTTV